MAFRKPFVAAMVSNGDLGEHGTEMLTPLTREHAAFGIEVVDAYKERAKKPRGGGGYYPEGGWGDIGQMKRCPEHGVGCLCQEGENVGCGMCSNGGSMPKPTTRRARASDDAWGFTPDCDGWDTAPASETGNVRWGPNAGWGWGDSVKSGESDFNGGNDTPASEKVVGDWGDGQAGSAKDVQMDIHNWPASPASNAGADG